MRTRDHDSFLFSAPDQCDCGENEECYDGECFCKEGYDRDEFGQCFWPEKGKSQTQNQRILSRTRQQKYDMIFP